LEQKLLEVMKSALYSWNCLFQNNVYAKHNRRS